VVEAVSRVEHKTVESMAISLIHSEFTGSEQSSMESFLRKLEFGVAIDQIRPVMALRYSHVMYRRTSTKEKGSQDK
jgi:hypothetical protein